MDKSSYTPRRHSNANNRNLSPGKSAEAFMTQLKESRQAFDIFKTQAEKKGMLGKKVPLLHSQAEYYSKYIKNRNLSAADESTLYTSRADININKGSSMTLPEHQLTLGQPSIRTSRNQIASSVDFPASTANRRKPQFVPLKQIIQRNHGDRVREYLDKMKGLSIDEIVKSTTLNAKAPKEEQKMGSQDVHEGMTAKQVSIVDNAKALAKNMAA